MPNCFVLADVPNEDSRVPASTEHCVCFGSTEFETKYFVCVAFDLGTSFEELPQGLFGFFIINPDLNPNRKAEVNETQSQEDEAKWGKWSTCESLPAVANLFPVLS